MSIATRLFGGSFCGVLMRLVLSIITLSSLYNWWNDGTATVKTGRTELNRAGYVLLALDQVVLPIKQYARTGDDAAPGDFEAKARRFRDVLATIQSSGSETKHVAEALQGQMSRIEGIAHELIASGPRPSEASARVDQLERLRDEAVLIVNDLREADLKQGEPSSPGIAGRLAGAGFAALGFCCAGGLALARFTVA